MEVNASRYHGKAPDELDWTDAQRQKRAVAEYLAALEVEARSQAEIDRCNSDGSDSGGNSLPDRKPPKVISPSDPSSAWTAKANKRVLFGYGLNYLIDVEHAIIVDVEATPARTYDEVAATRTMIERTRQRFGLSPKRLAADTAYGIAWSAHRRWVLLSIPLLQFLFPSVSYGAIVGNLKVGSFCRGIGSTITNRKEIDCVIAHYFRGNLILALWLVWSVGSFTGGLAGGVLLEKLGATSGKMQKSVLRLAYLVAIAGALLPFLNWGRGKG